MATSFDFKKLRTLMKIYTGVQVCLVLLLVCVGIVFQMKFQSLGRPQLFTKSALAALVIQLFFFYPINLFARREAEREIASSEIGLGVEAAAKFRKKRLIGDMVKVAVFIFFLTFIMRAPDVPLVQCSIFFTFILTMLSYFQCYNFAARRLMKEKG